MFKFLKKMTRNIKDVVVDKISLITRGKKPAVEMAENKFAIFKVAKNKKLSKKAIERLEKISCDYAIIKKDLAKK